MMYGTLMNKSQKLLLSLLKPYILELLKLFVFTFILQYNEPHTYLIECYSKGCAIICNLLKYDVKLWFQIVLEVFHLD